MGNHHGPGSRRKANTKVHLDEAANKFEIKNETSGNKGSKENGTDDKDAGSGLSAESSHSDGLSHVTGSDKDSTAPYLKQRVTLESVQMSAAVALVYLIFYCFL